MSYILNEKIYKKIEKVKTTKDLIYKDKVVDVHNIKDSYEQLVNKEVFKKSIIKYGDDHFYLNINDLEKTIKLLISITEQINVDGIKIVEKTLVSEILNSLWIEGVHSSKKIIKQTIKKANKKDFAGKMIVNYKNAFLYISTTQKINEDNLYTLYSILTTDIDMGNEKLDGFPYRQEQVQIGKEKYKGIEPSLINQSMDSMFELIETENEQKPIANDATRLINIALFHYLFEIVHPYYDMNGRTGRLFANWYAETNGLLRYISFLSEAINMFKNDLYYKAFEKSETNDFKLDATYFVQSFFISLIAQKIIYLTVKMISNKIKDKYKTKLNELEKDILFSLLSKKKNVFYKKEEFILGVDNINNATISLTLNKLDSFGLIETINTKPKEYKLLWTKDIEECIDDILGSNLNK